METNPAWVPGTNPTPPGSIRSAQDIALGLRLIEAAARAGDTDASLGSSLMAARLLGVGVATAITALQRAGKLPACDTPEWAQLVELAEDGQVAIAPVILIGADRYACDDVVERRVRGAAAARATAAIPVPAPASVSDGLREMGLL
jgi:hypothetical protein